MLVQAGHQVIEAPDGATALEILRENDSIALVLTDLVMPYMGGRELVRNLPPDSRPRVLYMSGYSDDVQIRQQSNLLDAEFIAKPFDVDELAAKIRQVLSGAPS
jgi:two-component system cell cycle sensor histidine kinase/response regulator CckA